jgi:hypothetical protein
MYNVGKCLLFIDLELFLFKSSSRLTVKSLTCWFEIRRTGELVDFLPWIIMLLYGFFSVVIAIFCQVLF